MTRIKQKIISGTRHGNLVLTGEYIKSHTLNGKRIYPKVGCLCDCGNIVYKKYDNLKSGDIKSCGMECIYRNKLINIKHGHARRKKYTKEYNAWLDLKYKSNLRKIRKIDIGYHAIFEEFDGFLNYIGMAPSENHRLCRIDKKIGFQPGNVHWYLGKVKESLIDEKQIRLSELIYVKY